MDLLIGGFVGGGAGATDGALAGLAQVRQSGTCEMSNGGTLNVVVFIRSLTDSPCWLRSSLAEASVPLYIQSLFSCVDCCSVAFCCLSTHVFTHLTLTVSYTRFRIFAFLKSTFAFPLNYCVADRCGVSAPSGRPVQAPRLRCARYVTNVVGVAIRRCRVVVPFCHLPTVVHV